MSSGGWVMDIGRSGSNGTGNRNLPGSSDPHVQEVVKAAHEELRQLMRQRADVMKRIGTVKQTIVGLANLFGDEVLSEELLELVDRKSGGRQPGFTKACRMVLMEAARPLGAREVCEHIQQRIPPVLLRHKDPLASVTTVLNRLVEYGEARTVVRENGRRAWQWVADPADSGFGHARSSPAHFRFVPVRVERAPSPAPERGQFRASIKHENVERLKPQSAAAEAAFLSNFAARLKSCPPESLLPKNARPCRAALGEDGSETRPHTDNYPGSSMPFSR